MSSVHRISGIALLIPALCWAAPGVNELGDPPSWGSSVPFIFGLLHGVPPLLAAMSGNRFVVLLAAAAVTIFAFAVGNMSYVALDLLGVGLGTAMGFKLAESCAEDKRRERAFDQRVAEEAARKESQRFRSELIQKYNLKTCPRCGDVLRADNRCAHCGR